MGQNHSPDTNRLTRRDALRYSGLGLLGGCASAWLPALAAEIANHPQRKKHCILLWMAGGPSQMDTFDMKPDHDNGGEFEEIATSVPGIRISQHLPTIAHHADRLAIVRGLNTKEGDHDRATHVMRTGVRPGGPVPYPSIPCSLSTQLRDSSSNLPDYVSIGATPAFAPAAFGPGFLGPSYAPVNVGTNDPISGEQQPNDSSSEFATPRVDNLESANGVVAQQIQGRRELWRMMQQDFLIRHQTRNSIAHDTAHRRAMRMMDGGAREAFDLSRESLEVRRAYGTGRFGQGCLLARRLVELGVPIVEVALGPSPDNPIGWDTHQDNFTQVRSRCQELDAGWGTLMTELNQRGLLDSTTILWMGEFGRTPQINNRTGRDHFPTAWTCVFAGGGIQGGSIHGQTSADGMEVIDGQVGVGNVLATFCRSVGVDPLTENVTDIGRPIRIAEGEPIHAILA